MCALACQSFKLLSLPLYFVVESLRSLSAHSFPLQAIRGPIFEDKQQKCQYLKLTTTTYNFETL